MPGVRRHPVQQSEPVHLQGHRELHRRARAASRSSIPGPIDERHVAALLDAVRGETVTHIFVTHTHRDHSPAVPRVKAATGADRAGRGAASRRAAAQCRRGAAARSQQRHRLPARPRARRRRGGRGRRLDHRGGRRRPATPPTTWRSRLQEAESAVLRRSRDGVVDAGGGAARRRDERLHGLARQARARARRPIYLPGHGGAVRNAPRFVRHYIRHRKAREASILHRLGKGAADIPTLVRAIYIGLDPRLVPAAGRSVLAHLEDLVARGRWRPRVRRRSRALPFERIANGVASYSDLFAIRYSLSPLLFFCRPAWPSWRAAAPAASPPSARRSHPRCRPTGCGCAPRWRRNRSVP